MVEPPEAFGEHPNAEISSALMDTETMLQTMISISGGSGGGGGANKDEMVFNTCEGLLAKIPDDVDFADVTERNASDVSPLKTVLLQEIERYNDLLSKVRSSIKLLQKGIQGFIVISSDQELIFNSLFAGSVPAAWLFAYPSLKPLGSWMPDLVDRIQLFTDWGFLGVPKVFWLGGFTYPTSFLTSLLQASARKNMISVDALSFDFIVQGADESQITAAPKEGAYIFRMLLEGAKWDGNANTLTDADAMQLTAPMPVVHFKPVAKKKTVTDGIYQCPLYLYPIRTGSRERPSFMIFIDLKSGPNDGNYWIKRGTALLLSVA